MANEIDNLIAEHFQELPSVIQDVVLHSNWQDKIRNIVLKYKLHIDQGAAIENLVILTMLGVHDPADFVDLAKNYARVTEDQALSISEDVEREIFHDIRQKLISITETHDTIEEVERVTNELTKADDDIDRAAQSQAQTSTQAPDAEVHIISKASRTPLVPQKKPKLVRIESAAPTPKGKMRIIEATPPVKTAPAVKPRIIDAAEKKHEAPKAVPVPTPSEASRLNTPAVSARSRLELELSGNNLTSIAPTTKNIPATYKAVDPYREPVE